MNRLAEVAWCSLAIGFICAAWLAAEQFRRPQRMRIMYVVWPVTALYLGPLALLAYYTMGLKTEKPFWQQVFVGVTHCGSGCTLGDIVAESAVYGSRLAGAALWPYLAADYICAYVLGIVFQYFSVRGIWAAVKADTLSLTAFELGLFGWMALTHFVIFHPALAPDQPVYWFMMQVGMCLGFVTAYPMNWWLIKSGLKEGM